MKTDQNLGQDRLMVLLVSKTAPTPLQIPGYEPSRKGSATKIAESFLDEPPTKKNILATFATHEKLKLLFVKYNTALPFNAAVERPFSTEKGAFRPKRAGLSDEHFNMLVFLKGNFNKYCFAILSDLHHSSCLIFKPSF